jgi:excisionase family DNA binding protein
MSTTAHTRPLLRVGDVARRLDCSFASVYRLERSGRLRGVRLSGGLLRFRPEDVEALIENGRAQ